MKKDRLIPYRYWTKPQFKKAILTNLDYLNVPIELHNLWRDLIIEGLNSKEWDSLIDYNGCTIVQDILHPCPACFCHDYMWISGHGGKDSDKLFKLFMSFEPMSKAKINRRWLGVRIGWFLWFKWKRKNKGNTKAMINLISYLEK